MSPRVLSVLLVLIPFAITSCGGEANRPVQSTTTPEQKNPAAPLVPKVEIHDWCKEHGVPESICTRCNESLVAGFKQKGDWCDQHGLPDSQCFVCHPELEAEFKAKAPKGAVDK